MKAEVSGAGVRSFFFVFLRVSEIINCHESYIPVRRLSLINGCCNSPLSSYSLSNAMFTNYSEITEIREVYTGDIKSDDGVFDLRTVFDSGVLRISPADDVTVSNFQDIFWSFFSFFFIGAKTVRLEDKADGEEESAPNTKVDRSWVRKTRNGDK